MNMKKVHRGGEFLEHKDRSLLTGSKLFSFDAILFAKIYQIIGWRLN